MNSTLGDINDVQITVLVQDSTDLARMILFPGENSSVRI